MRVLPFCHFSIYAGKTCSLSIIRICAGSNGFFDLFRQHNIRHKFILNLNLLAARTITGSAQLLSLGQFIMGYFDPFNEFLKHFAR